MHPNEPIAARWWSVVQAQARYGISPSTVRRLVAEQLVEGRKLGSKLLISDDSMHRYLTDLPLPSIKVDDRSRALALAAGRTGKS